MSPHCAQIFEAPWRLVTDKTRGNLSNTDELCCREHGLNAWHPRMNTLFGPSAGAVLQDLLGVQGSAEAPAVGLPTPFSPGPGIELNTFLAATILPGSPSDLQTQKLKGHRFSALFG